jgi:hypothetical protein
MRPHGDPDGLAAAARALVAAAAEMERVGDGLGDLGRDLAGPDAWRGRASEAYRARDGLLEVEVGRAATALRQAGAGLSGLSAGLAAAQALWDRASSLAASAGLELDPAGPDGPLALRLPSIDPRVVTAARVAEMTREATEQAASADRSAAHHLAEAVTTAPGAAGPGGWVAASGRLAWPAAGAAGGHGGPGGPVGGEGAGGRGDGEHEGRSLLARGLRVADRIGVAVGAGLAAVKARASALMRLVQSGSEPASSLAAVRALAAFERSALTDTMVAFLPLGGPLITLAANLAGGEGDEPVVRALVRSLGESIGADAGQRVGMAACAAESAATEGAGSILCPALTIATTSVGATLGGRAAVRIYDALGPEPSPHPATVLPGRPP